MREDPVVIVDMWRKQGGMLSASGGGRVFVLDDVDYDGMVAALHVAGLVEGLASPSMDGPTIATVDAVMMQFPFAPQVDYANRRRFVLPGGDYDETVAALKVAGFIEALL